MWPSVKVHLCIPDNAKCHWAAGPAQCRRCGSHGRIGHSTSWPPDFLINFLYFLNKTSWSGFSHTQHRLQSMQSQSYCRITLTMEGGMSMHEECICCWQAEQRISSDSLCGLESDDSWQTMHTASCSWLLLVVFGEEVTAVFSEEVDWILDAKEF